MSEIEIGEVSEGWFDPTARLVPTAEWIDLYAGLTTAEKEELMHRVETPSTPQLRSETKEAL